MRFEEILKKGIERGHMPMKSQRARLWYRATAQQVTSPVIPYDQKSRIRSKVEIGSMYMYSYNPKTKDKLPYYDRFPVIFVVGPAEGGFYGLNLHYLPIRLRARLMDALYKIASDKSYTDNMKLNLSYELLKGTAQLKWFAPCLKRYLDSHVQSQFMYVHPYEWDAVLFLPLAKFEKKSQEEVWKDSERKIRQRSRSSRR